MNINDLEPETIVKDGRVKWKVTGITTKEMPLGPDKIMVELEVLDGRDDLDMWPDEGTIKTIEKDEFETRFERVDA